MGVVLAQFSLGFIVPFCHQRPNSLLYQCSTIKNKKDYVVHGVRLLFLVEGINQDCGAVILQRGERKLDLGLNLCSFEFRQMTVPLLLTSDEFAAALLLLAAVFAVCRT